MIQLVMKRNQFAEIYKEEKVKLDNRKDQLFKSQDIKKWDLDTDKLSISRVDLMSSKILCKRYMLPKETNDLVNLRDYWGYFNTQVQQETANYVESKYHRMAMSLQDYVDGSNERINHSIGIIVNLSTKLL